MARPKKAESQTGTTSAPPPPPGTGSNQPDRNTILFYAGLFRQDLEKAKARRLERKKLRQRAKLANVDIEQLDAAISELDREDGTTLEQLRSFRDYCFFLGLPVGSQLTLFKDPRDKRASSVEDILARAERLGFECGIQGLSPDDQAFPPMTPEGQAHLKGWNAGQDVWRQKIGQYNAEGEAADRKSESEKPADPAELPPDAETQENLDELAGA